MRGRPPVTRARVLTYWAKHGPCTVMQVVRATGAERAHVYRILKGRYGPLWRAAGEDMGFCLTNPPMAA